MPKFTMTFESDDDEEETADDIIEAAERLLQEEGFSEVVCTEVTD